MVELGGKGGFTRALRRAAMIEDRERFIAGAMRKCDVVAVKGDNTVVSVSVR